jgi:L-asparaginase
MSNVEVRGRIGPDGPKLLVLYTGGTIGMGPGPDGALVPLDLSELGDHLPFIKRLPLSLTVATFTDPLDSSAIGTSDWLSIADTIVEHAPGHAGVVVLHGTDTMAYTASALSFLLEGITIPIVLTGSQRPVTELRSDGRENLVTALAVAAGHLRGAHLVPEVTIFFDALLLRGNRAVKVHADSYQGFGSPNHAPLATAGVTIDFAVDNGVTVVVIMQCRAGSVSLGTYATGSALLATGAIPGGDMTFEAALTKLMVLTDRHGPDDVRRLMQEDLAGELTV